MNKISKKVKRLILGSLAVTFAGLAAAGCNQSADKIVPVAPDQPKIVGAPKVGKVQGKGGTKIAVLVNSTAITTNQIKRRAAFVRLRRMKGNRTKIATDELIDESIKMQEARRLGAVASNAQVNSAYAQFAKSNKMSVANLNKAMAQSGVTQRGFKDYIKASISWQRVVGARAQAEASGSAGQTAGSGPSWLPAAGTQSSKETEYTIQQIVFIVPASKRRALMPKRRVEAKRFRAQLDGCRNARELASVLKDVTVLERGRLLESALPPRWAKDIKATPAGKVTRVQDDTKGVEMIAVCKTREVIGGSGSIDPGLLSSKPRAAISNVEKKYFEELKSLAVIQKR